VRKEGRGREEGRGEERREWKGEKGPRKEGEYL